MQYWNHGCWVVLVPDKKQYMMLRMSESGLHALEDTFVKMNSSGTS